jgi:hypothetical protein
MQKGISKLQIRAEVLMMLQQLSDFDDIPKSELEKCLTQINSYNNLDSVLEVLLKELPRSEFKMMQVIAYFLVELGTLEKLKDQLWEYIKDPASSDVLKDLSGIILKSHGDTSTPDELLSYLENPDELVDSETQKLLEIAAINPEAQIDFLDFLFSLPPDEQINLVNSLKEDFSNKHLANVFIPVLESNPSEELSSVIVESMGEIRSPYAVSCLNDIIEYSKSENLRKLAKKSLQMLKISGIDLQESLTLQLGAEVCANSKIYKCYASIIDGAGNQGIIISRKKDNGDILTFSTVINDQDGILDCFGFFGISNNDYVRIIKKFQGELAAVPVSPEYCKCKLIKSEKINKTNNIPIRYEYLSWKGLICDVEPLKIDKIFKDISHWVEPVYFGALGVIFSHPELKYWFLGEEHSDYMKKFLAEILQDILQNQSNYVLDRTTLLKYLDNKVKSAIPEIFNPDLINIYEKRLSEVAYLFDIQGIELLRNIAASIAVQLKEQKDQASQVMFFDYILKKSIIEHIIRCQYKQEQNTSTKTASLWGKKDKTENRESIVYNLTDIIDILNNEWRKEEND